MVRKLSLAQDEWEAGRQYFSRASMAAIYGAQDGKAKWIIKKKLCLDRAAERCRY